MLRSFFVCRVHSIICMTLFLLGFFEILNSISKHLISFLFSEILDCGPLLLTSVNLGRLVLLTVEPYAEHRTIQESSGSAGIYYWPWAAPQIMALVHLLIRLVSGPLGPVTQGGLTQQSFLFRPFDWCPHLRASLHIFYLGK